MPSSSYDSAIAFLKGGPSRPTLFEVDIPLQEVLGKPYRETEDYLRLFSESLNLPDVSHDFIAIPGYSSMGITQKVPIMPVYGQDSSLQIKVIESQDWKAYNAFRQLYDMTGVNIGHTPSSSRNIRMKYKDEFQFTMSVTKLEYSREIFENKGKKGRNIERELSQHGTKAGYYQVCKFTFLNCYVTAISNIALSSQAIDQVLTYNVGIQYDSFSLEFLNE